ncbi:phosphoadenosine phosphosulfate reductase family protein [Actinomadura sp. NPDC048955]|uniref:phosphoadenosine phosphosulfate reductase domain-containing protein n=1 Tax=Actinomadura sp. NPDC048955 TaxID=3158228 RepID=UPI0033FD9025
MGTSELSCSRHKDRCSKPQTQMRHRGNQIVQSTEHAAAYGLRFEIVHRITKDGRQQSLLEHIEERGKFPSAHARYCTSDMKTAPGGRLITRLAAEARAEGTTGPVPILSVLGNRAQESTDRAAMPVFHHDGGRTCPCPSCQSLPQQERPKGRSNTRKHIDRWLPIHHWTTAQVFDRCRREPTLLHPAYTLGFPRASCIFCVLASKSALVRACQVMPELAERYAALEDRIDHTIKHRFSIKEAIKLAAQADGPVPVSGWKW